MKARHVVTVLAGLALVAGTTAVLAQGMGGGRGPGSWGRHGGFFGAGMGPLGRLIHRLDLTQEQKDSIKAILDQEQPTFQALRQQLREGRQAFRAAHPITSTEVDEAGIRAHVADQAKVMADLAVAAAKTRAQVMNVLTPDQRNQLAQMQQQFKERMQQRMQERSGGSGS
jgi:Spy/CpxP family protein refolding chaperone